MVGKYENRQSNTVQDGNLHLPFCSRIGNAVGIPACGPDKLHTEGVEPCWQLREAVVASGPDVRKFKTTNLSRYIISSCGCFFGRIDVTGRAIESTTVEHDYEIFHDVENRNLADPLCIVTEVDQAVLYLSW